MFLNLRSRPNALRIPHPKPGIRAIIEAHSPPSPRQIRRLLGAMVSQAMLDGMVTIRFSVNNTGQFEVFYRSPSTQLDNQWQMTAPPSDVYPFLLKEVLSMAALDSHMPLSGRIEATVASRPVTLMFACADVRCFEISWSTDALALC
jgi:hypothetical protein